MIADKRLFFKGAALLAGFSAVLIVLFMPLFKDGNALNYLDNLYNAISKGSAYYIPSLQEENAAYQGTPVQLTLAFPSTRQAEETAKLFEAGGAGVTRNETDIVVDGDLGAILEGCLADADAMFHNRGEAIREKYGFGERQVLHHWWTALAKMDIALKKQKMFKEAKFVGSVNQRAVECAYNYYEITPQKITDKVGIVIFSLAFYVIYTLWFGFSIMYLFEGWGMRLEH
jgi:hypothetical protein